jgi:hypothetical protein
MKSLIRFFTLVIMLSARVVQAAGDPVTPGLQKTRYFNS